LQFHRLYKLTFILSLIFTSLSVVSLAFCGTQKGLFGWLFLCFPVLWLLWICCVFLVKLPNVSTKLVRLWFIIDLSILILFLSFSMSIENWTKSNGIDMVILISYLPFTFIPWLFLNLIPKTIESAFFEYINMLEKLFRNDLGNTVMVWAIASGFTVIQSFLLIIFAKYVRKKKDGFGE